MSFVVRLSAAARSDFVERHAYVASQANEGIADRYLARVERRLSALDRFPERGSPRPEFGEGIRALTFERRLLILYRIEDDTVMVLRLLDAVRDLGGSITL